MNRKAFTLVELAIVIVIIGLLVGGVLAGQQLIRQSEVRRFITDMHSIESAVLQYHAKYAALPGDDRQTLTKFPGCTSVSSVCTNGNGDRNFDANETPFSALISAKLIKGAICNVMGTNPSTIDHLDSPIAKACWRMHRVTATVYGTTNFNAINMVTRAGDGVFSPEESFQIDQKADDGIASSGKYLSLDAGSQAICTDVLYNTAPAGGANYVMTQTGVVCRPFYKLHVN